MRHICHSPGDETKPVVLAFAEDFLRAMKVYNCVLLVTYCSHVHPKKRSAAMEEEKGKRKKEDGDGNGNERSKMRQKEGFTMRAVELRKDSTIKLCS